MENKKELAYYITMFTLEGHKTWRCHLGGDEQSFTREWNLNTPGSGKKPKVTMKHVLKIDRVTGQIIPLP